MPRIIPKTCFPDGDRLRNWTGQLYKEDAQYIFFPPATLTEYSINYAIGFEMGMNPSQLQHEAEEKAYTVYSQIYEKFIKDPPNIRVSIISWLKTQLTGKLRELYRQNNRYNAHIDAYFEDL